MKKLYLLFIVGILLLMGCKNSQDYSLKLQGENELFAITDEVKGTPLPEESLFNESHSFTITWLGKEVPRAATIRFSNYTTMNHDTIKLSHINQGKGEMDFAFNKEKTAKGVGVLRVMNTNNSIPDQIQTLEMVVEYEYGSSVEKVKKSITLEKVN